MAQHSKKSNDGNESAATHKGGPRNSDGNQLDFELEFYGAILARHPDYVDVLRIMGNLLTLKGRFVEGLQSIAAWFSSARAIRWPITTSHAATPCSSAPSNR
jgi:hypothetical protein